MSNCHHNSELTKRPTGEFLQQNRTVPAVQIQILLVLRAQFAGFDLNSGTAGIDRGHGTAVSLPRSIVGTRHCRVLTSDVSPAQADLFAPTDAVICSIANPKILLYQKTSITLSTYKSGLSK